MIINLKNFTPIKGFEETHLINKETQQVYSLIKKKMLKGSLNEGYKVFYLKNRNGVVKMRPLHRLMMETFAPNPNNYPVINHKDGNKLNNCLNNLEWCTLSYNNKEAYRLGLRVVSEKTKQQFMRDCHSQKHIEQAKDNLLKSKEKAIARSKEKNSFKIELVKENTLLSFDSCNDASKFLGVAHSTICRAIKRQNNNIKGYEIKRVL